MCAQLATGGELMKRLGSDASVYSEDEVRKHVSTILRAVEYMHQQHCVHRDLKPENVLLSDNRYDTRAAAQHGRQHSTVWQRHHSSSSTAGSTHSMAAAP